MPSPGAPTAGGETVIIQHCYFSSISTAFGQYQPPFKNVVLKIILFSEKIKNAPPHRGDVSLGCFFFPLLFRRQPQ
ncbi:MAG: hypothetical protein IKF77_08035, partial [Thermoguttaceae bacterium]|nr:hypothetical protein [Thermoguttaceae bacterium]